MADPVMLSYVWADHVPPPEVDALDGHLRACGVPVWRDVRDLSAGGENETAARDLILGPASGMILYFTSAVLESWFVTSVELPAVQERLHKDPEFFVSAVFDGTGKDEANKLRERVGIPLLSFQGLFLDRAGDVDAQLADFAGQILERYLTVRPSATDALAVDSWNEIPWTDPHVIQLNWAGLFGTEEGDSPNPRTREIIGPAGASLKKALRSAGPEREVTIEGSLHLSAAFALGWTFREPTRWTLHGVHPKTPVRTASNSADNQGWTMVPRSAQTENTTLLLTVNATRDVEPAVLKHREGEDHRVALSVRPPVDPSRDSLNEVEMNGLAVAIVDAVHEARASQHVEDTDLFLACPWTFALCLGWHWGSTGNVRIFEALPDRSGYHSECLQLP